MCGVKVNQNYYVTCNTSSPGVDIKVNQNNYITCNTLCTGVDIKVNQNDHVTCNTSSVYRYGYGYKNNSKLLHFSCNILMSTSVDIKVNQNDYIFNAIPCVHTGEEFKVN